MGLVGEWDIWLFPTLVLTRLWSNVELLELGVDGELDDAETVDGVYVSRRSRRLNPVSPKGS